MKVVLKDIYLEYTKRYGEEVTEAEFKQVCYLFNKKLSSKLIDGYKFTMPDKLGTLSVAKNKMRYNKLYFNFEEYNRTGIKSYHLNDHSDNYYAFVRWNKTNCRVPNKSYYGFRFTRENNRNVAKVMKSKNGHQMYEIANRKDAV